MLWCMWLGWGTGRGRRRGGGGEAMDGGGTKIEDSDPDPDPDSPRSPETTAARSDPIGQNANPNWSTRRSLYSLGRSGTRVLMSSWPATDAAAYQRGLVDPVKCEYSISVAPRRVLGVRCSSLGDEGSGDGGDTGSRSDRGARCEGRFWWMKSRGGLGQVVQGR